MTTVEPFYSFWADVLCRTPSSPSDQDTERFQNFWLSSLLKYRAQVPHEGFQVLEGLLRERADMGRVCLWRLKEQKLCDSLSLSLCVHRMLQGPMVLYDGPNLWCHVWTPSPLRLKPGRLTETIGFCRPILIFRISQDSG